MEKRIVNTQLISLNNTRLNQIVVRQLVPLFREEGVSGLVLLFPRSNPMQRYKPAANAEIVAAAIAAGHDSVQALVAEWPSDLPELIPWDLLLQSASAQASTVETVAPSTTTPDQGPLARAAYFAGAVKQYGSQAKAAQALKLHRSTINNALQLLKLHPVVQSALLSQHINESAARTIALTDKIHQVTLLDWYLSSESRPSIRELERAVRFIGQGEGDFRVGSLLEGQFATLIGETYGCQVSFQTMGQGGRCIVSCTDPHAHIISHILNIAAPRHKATLIKDGEGAKLSFRYADSDDLMQILPELHEVETAGEWG